MSQPSFDQFVRVRGPVLVRYAFLLTADWALAEDLVQEALALAFPKWRRIERMEYPDAYVKQVVTRRFLSWRRRRSTGETPSGLSLAETTAEVPIDGIEDRDVMWTALNALSRQQRAVLVLRYYEDLGDDRVAEILGCSQSTVRVHASRGLAALRDGARSSLRPGAEP